MSKSFLGLDLIDENRFLHRRVNALALRMTRAASLLEDIDTGKMSVGDYRIIQRVLSELTEEAGQ